MKPYLYAVILSGALAGCGLGETEPAGPTVSLECSQDVSGTAVIATNNCDKSTRTAEPFVVEPLVIEAPAE